MQTLLMMLYWVRQVHLALAAAQRLAMRLAVWVILRRRPSILRMLRALHRASVMGSLPRAILVQALAAAQRLAMRLVA